MLPTTQKNDNFIREYQTLMQNTSSNISRTLEFGQIVKGKKKLAVVMTFFTVMQ